MRDVDKKEVLSTWLGLQEWLENAKEADVAELLKYESVTKKRSSFLLRIHGKLARLRNTRERAELMRVADA